jgi:hypothetical protein
LSSGWAAVNKIPGFKIVEKKPLVPVQCVGPLAPRPSGRDLFSPRGPHRKEMATASKYIHEPVDGSFDDYSMQLKFPVGKGEYEIIPPRENPMSSSSIISPIEMCDRKYKE